MIFALALALSTAHADEGMWLPEQLPEHAERLAELGLELPVEQLADPMGKPLGSIVSLGFCSASFISPDGLIATNHHCVSGYLSYLGSAEENLARDGFLAGSREQERWAGPGSELTITESIEDVTAQVRARMPRRMTDRLRREAIETARKELVAACEVEPDRRCRVVGDYGGRTWRLIKARELKDVRLVYAPPESVGSYGGEVDNWMWPRHAGDFALLRAYVAPDGSAAEHAADNVPYQPPHFLELDTSGAQPGDLVMVAGFPGRTERYSPAWALAWKQQRYYPDRIAEAEAILAVLRDEASKSEEAAARLAAPIDWVGNGLKYSQGMVDNFASSQVVARVAERDAALDAWIAADRKRQRTHGKVLEELRALEEAAWQRYETDRVHRNLGRYVDLLGSTIAAYRLAKERQRPDLQREAGFQERDEERIANRARRLERTLWLPADRRLMALVLEQHAALPVEQRILPLDTWLAAQGGIQAALDRLFTEPTLAGTEARLALLQADRAAFESSDDPWVQLAVALEQWQEPRREHAKEEEGARLRLQPLYMEALLASQDRPVYPDANSSLRVSFGRVEGYPVADGLFATSQTTVAGMAAKAGDWPFDAPERLLAAAASAPDSRWADPTLGDVPVDFLTTLDTTGGSSGSATLNARGQLVGLIFDGNYESMSADYLFDPDLTRSIHVDVRYLLWMLEEVEQAHWLLEELGQAPR